MTEFDLRQYEALAVAQPPPVRDAVLELVASVRLLQQRQRALVREAAAALDVAPGKFGKHWPYDLP